MGSSKFSWNKFNAVPMVGIMRNFKQSDIEQILPVYVENGFNTIEVTMNSPGAVESISFALKNFGDRLNVGAGTVCTESDLDVALKAGAQFIVTPVTNLNVIDRCREVGVPIFSGAFTPTEIFAAWNAGADMVKVFPMVGDAIEYLKAIRGPLPQVKLLPTGGVSLENVASFFAAGASGVGAGGQLFDKKFIEKKDWAALGAHFAAFAAKIVEIRKGS